MRARDQLEQMHVSGLFLLNVNWYNQICYLYVGFIAVNQQFSTGVPHKFLKHAIPDYLVRGTDIFSLRLSN